eukprot:scaffold3716_cov69-Cylindrotheca_fusiformis.AAC.7
MSGNATTPTRDQIIRTELLIQNCPDAPRKPIRPRVPNDKFYEDTKRRLFHDVDDKEPLEQKGNKDQRVVMG